MNVKMIWTFALTSTSVALACAMPAEAQYRRPHPPTPSNIAQTPYNRAQIQQQQTQQVIRTIDQLLFGNGGNQPPAPPQATMAAPALNADGTITYVGTNSNTGLSNANPYGGGQPALTNQPSYNPYWQTQQPTYQPQSNPYYQNPYQTSQPYTTTASTGQRYQIPGGYANSPGSVINYGGTSYQINYDGTMSPYSGVQQTSYQPTQTQSNGQRYQIPAGYQGYSVGSVISYGGNSYQIGADGTMTASSSTTNTTTTAASQPASGQRYQVPAEYAGTAAGYIINYGGANYLTAGDGTMTPY